MELKSAVAPVVATSAVECGPPEPTSEVVPIPSQAPPAQKQQTSGTGARLTLRRGGALSQEVFSIASGPAVIGHFDPETGPVDVDLGPLPEAVYISRHHAEIWSDDSGRWFIKDLGSGNGTFVCAAGERQFRKASGDQSIHDGDEIAFGNARFQFCADRPLEV